MRALVIDAAASCMTIAAKNEEMRATLALDLGQRQSMTLLPAVDYVLSQTGLKPQELDYMALTSGPGAFTGLRLAFSALKAIELAHNIPLYGILSTDAYAFPFRNFDGQVVSVIDAKKDQFYAAVYERGKTICETEDTTAQNVAGKLSREKKILLAGPDAEIFSGELKKIDPSLNIVTYLSQPLPADALFEIAEETLAQKKEPLADYDGPVYLRKSEAEIKLENAGK